MATCGIYGFLQISTGMWYIGQSIDIERREQEHRTSIAQDWHKLLLINPNDFHFAILEECSPELLDERENYYIDLYKSFEHGFNSTHGNHVKSNVKLDTSDFHILFDDGEDEQEIAKIIRAIRTKTFKATLLKILNKNNYDEVAPQYWLRKKFHDSCYLIQVLYFSNNSFERDYKFIYLNLENYINQERDQELINIIKADKIWWEDIINSSNQFNAWYYISRRGSEYTCNKYFQVSNSFYVSSINVHNTMNSIKDVQQIQQQAELQRIDCKYFYNK